MKIRTGFVSNSSSSSFIIYGATLETNKMIEKFYKEGKGDLNNWEVMELVDDLVGEKYEVHQIEYQEDYIEVGINPTNQPDDITHGEWKAGIKKELTELFGPGLVFGWVEDCSYDG